MRGREKYPNFIFSQFHNEVPRWLHLSKKIPAKVCVEKVAWHALPGSCDTRILTEALVLTALGLV